MYIQDTLSPYMELEHRGIQYANCRDFSHISRYKGMRQIVHNPNDSDRFIALENCNPFSTSCDVVYHTVKEIERNRLDLIADKYLGSASYSWVIAYFNRISDGFSISPGQRLAIPKNISSLFATGEILAPISAFQLNLGSE